MTRIRRSGVTARKAATKVGKRSTLRKARAQTGSAFDQLMALLPFSDEMLHHIFLGIILLATLALVWIVASFAGVPALAEQQVTRLARQAGFQVVHIVVRGTHHLSAAQVYDRVLSQNNQAMPLLNLDALRADLLQLPWVSDARVSRQLPDTLVVDIIERSSRAVLRTDGPAGTTRWMLVDATGHPLEAISPARARRMIDQRLLVVAGDGVSDQIGALDHLLDAAPAMRAPLVEADWVGFRRWNLIFNTQQVLELPEGEEANAALVTFARLDGVNRLLGGRAASFDMRATDRIYFRVPGRMDEAHPSSAMIMPESMKQSPLSAKPTTNPALQGGN